MKKTTLLTIVSIVISQTSFVSAAAVSTGTTKVTGAQSAITPIELSVQGGTGSTSSLAKIGQNVTQLQDLGGSTTSSSSLEFKIPDMPSFGGTGTGSKTGKIGGATGGIETINPLKTMGLAPAPPKV